MAKINLSLAKQLQQLEEQLLQPAIRKSANELAMLLADEFIEFSSSGHMYNKQRAINFLATEEPSNFSITNFNISPLTTNLVLVTYGLIKNKNKSAIHSLRSSIWKFMDHRWQIIFHQGTVTDSAQV